MKASLPGFLFTTRPEGEVAGSDGIWHLMAGCPGGAVPAQLRRTVLALPAVAGILTVMNGRERVRLLHGPYQAPALKKGDRATWSVADGTPGLPLVAGGCRP